MAEFVKPICGTKWETNTQMTSYIWVCLSARKYLQGFAEGNGQPRTDVIDLGIPGKGS